jgi:hypothetical protein
MNEAKHTPGPWHFCGSQYSASDKPAVTARNTGTGYLTPEGWHYVIPAIDGATNEQAEANARLIAAAPDLLSALAALVDSLASADEEGLLEHAPQMEAARAAIAAATGRTQ